ncbi:transcriptional regulator NrdR [Aquabacterium sp.]|jgi:transcriptional repressor NrdR|uniref:transcriptional regulator NrdR n=1 Tax=Aquabacterium sp. TaxID=1872578 RepID=UPI00248A0BFB|nr:transcriptional regulator NrdR [Aquabacterium sp.]MDI1348542.1 transcriptional regulator NrdR [Aquabacterium sp.]|tara:strand:- start:2387 stop:2860 length:474 start_codon:yes stop_codon:yes gene_type:complete
MRCPFCGHLETQVVETRDSDEGDSIRRRRKCHHCDKRFTTYERAEIELPAIVKRDGRRTDYERAKLKGSMMIALRKRPVSAEALEGAIEAIEARLRQSGDKEVDSTQLGEWVMRELRKLDKVAYVRFASVYRSFDDVSEFVAAIKETGKAASKKAEG